MLSSLLWQQEESGLIAALTDLKIRAESLFYRAPPFFD
jgi:hypothetical protein